MGFESVRGYVQLASGLGELTKAKAMEAAQGLLALPGADEVGRRAMQASALADQLLEAAKANRSSLIMLVRSEIEGALSRAEVARVADLEVARARLTVLAKEVEDLRAAVLGGAARSPLGRAVPGVGSGARPASAVTTAPRPVAPSAQPAPPTSTTAKKATAKKATAKKATAKKATAKKATAKKATAEKATAKKATAKRATAKKATAKKATAKRATAKKASSE
jgi:hypothetical protein